jgi:uncharacterized protein (TIGR02453 family)
MKIIKFLENLKENNNRDWFKANKPYFEEVKQEFMDMVEYLIPALAVTNPALANLEAKDTIFRIYRDVRFGKNKSPYKISMGAIMTPGGRKSAFAGHYFHIEPGGSFLAGGAYSPPSDRLKSIRSEIYYNSTEFKSIITSVDFIKYFGEIEGSKLKRPPVGFPKDFADIDLLKFKDYTVFHKIDDDDISNPDFLKTSVSIFEKMNPFIGFLNRAIY